MSNRIRELRNAKGWSQPELARRVGCGYTTIVKWERDEREVRQRWWPKLASVFGITEPELFVRKGYPVQADLPPGFEGNDAPGGDEEPHGVEYRPVMRIAELDVSAAAGFGSLEEAGESEVGEPVVAEWQMPRDLVRGITAAMPDHLKIIRIKGTSMAPDYLPGERVLVDVQDKAPSPSGAFVVWDGIGLVVKYLEIVPGSDPPTVRLISRNETFGSYDRPLADVHINGRVVGKWLWT